MSLSNDSLSDNERETLKEGIKKKYYQYHLEQPDRFPEFRYNTNRANYEALRASFEEEFYIVRGLDRVSHTVHIPSTNTLAVLFTDESYIPNKKILNTCHSYAEGPTVLIESPDILTPPVSSPPSPPKWMLVGILVGVFGLGMLYFIGRRLIISLPHDLVIDRPISNSKVLQEVIVEGRVVDADIVWLVVRAKTFYYVQPAAKVQANNWWISVVFIGGLNHDSDGYPYQVRAFVNPTQEMKSGMILRDWPEAELSSKVMNVIRYSQPD